jgi:hypothetical protein
MFKKTPCITEFAVIQNIKKVIYTGVKNVNFFQWLHSSADQGNYMFIPLFGKETQLLLWTGSRAAHVKNTIQLPELKNYIYEIKFYNNTAIIILPNCFIKRKYYLTQKSFILNTGTSFHL